MSGMAVPYILPLENIIDEAVGGKAKGLAQLINLDLPVPKGFVIVNARAGIYPHDLALAYGLLGGGKVAVRSSALGEDAGDNSFAGQFETLLNVQGEAALKQAIDACVHSLDNERAKAYQNSREHQQESIMCIVVQNMVDAAFAGVLFTVDPVSGRYDRLVIDAIDGLGEALVSGEASSDHYLLANDNTIIEELLAGDKRLLGDNAIKQLANGARDAAKRMGEPLDMEWAIDKAGQLFWLQARPITTIGSDLHELDTVNDPAHVFTRCNIGEIFPGPSCPLTYSIQGRFLDVSMNYMQARFMAIDFEQYARMSHIAYSGGHMFLNLTASLDASRYSVLARAEETAQSICGFTIPELVEPTNKKNIVRRIVGIRDFYRFVTEAHEKVTDLAMRMKAFFVEYQHESLPMYQEIQKKLPWLQEATTIHLQSSAMSGLLEGILQNVISKGQRPPSSEHQAMAAKLFAGAKQVESAMLVAQLDQVVDLVAAHPQGKSHFHDVSTAQALAWINSPEAGSITVAFESFMHLHGHRSYRELCLQEKAWIDEPEKLIASMQASVMSRFSNSRKVFDEVHIDIASQPWLVRFLLPKAHAAIRRREYSKSMMVKSTHIIKRAYRHLGQLMLQEGKIDDAELVFYFLNEELGEFISGQHNELLEKAKKRRIAHEFQERLIFSDVYIGNPAPIEQEKISLQDGQMQGRPVSRGIVEGVVRVANNITEAAALQPGEILIAPVTDVGWTPYFSLIAGLVTNVGSAVSHGAVIAREYGLPCIVNAQGATEIFKTGDRIRLDADTGVITKL
jgi:rifampicin phosphotransferase